MTVPIQDPIVSYTGNGIATVFTIPFRILLDEDLIVYLSGTIASAYVLSGLGDDEATLTFTTAPANGAPIIAYRQVALERQTDYQFNGDLRAVSVNADFDRVWMALQDTAGIADRSLHYPIEEFELTAELPSATVRATKALIFDAQGNAAVSNGPYQEGELIVQEAIDAANAIVGSITVPTFQAFLPIVLRDGVDYTSGTSNSVALPATTFGKTISGVFMDGTFQSSTQYTLNANETLLTFSSVIPQGIGEINVLLFSPSLLGLFQQSGFGAVPRTFQDKQRDIIGARDFGIRADGVTDDTAAFNRALSTMVLLGGTLELPAGQINASGNGLTLDQSLLNFGSLKHVSIRGAGSGATKILYSGTGTAFTYKGAQPNGVNSFCTIEGIRFEGVSQTAGTGLTLLDASGFTLRDVVSTLFGTGINGIDVLQSTFEHCVFGANSAGGFFQYSNFSPPNALTFINCEIISNLNTGMLFADPSTVLFLGGAVQGNGVGTAAANTYGIAIFGGTGLGGLNGAAGATFISVYFEQNVGNADIWFIAGAVDGATSLTATACTFNRISNVNFVTNNVRMDVNGPNKAKLTLLGNGFQGFNSYATDPSRRYVIVNPSGGSVYDVTDLGNLYGSSVEKPVFLGPTKGDAAMATQYCTFDGTSASPVAINGFNTGLITKNGTGDYSITFEKQGPRSNFPVHITINGAGFCQVVSTAAANYRFKTLNASQVATDFSYVSLACFGNGDVT